MKCVMLLKKQSSLVDNELLSICLYGKHLLSFLKTEKKLISFLKDFKPFTLYTIINYIYFINYYTLLSPFILIP